MRTIVLLLALLTIPVFAAPNPSFQSFDTNVFNTNGYSIKLSSGVSNQWKIDATNIASTIINQSITQNIATIGATFDGAQIFSSGFSGGADLYFLDFRKTNSLGQILMYQSILATNTCNLVLTNCALWSLLSLNIVASGTNATILFPTNLPHLDTNGLPVISGRYSIVLTNGHDMRLTLQSNKVGISSLWATPEQ